MALDTKVATLLDNFADSQPALQLPTEPAGTANPKIGTALQAALAAATAAASATTASYTPAAGADWADPDPTTVKTALDRLAAAVAGLLTTPIP